MATIRMTLEDNEGRQVTEQYELPDNLDSLDDVDVAIEQFKNEALPRLEQELLQQAEARALAAEKKAVSSLMAVRA